MSAIDVMIMVKGACEASRSFLHIDPRIGERQLDLVRAAIGAAGPEQRLRGRKPTVEDLERTLPAASEAL